MIHRCASRTIALCLSLAAVPTAVLYSPAAQATRASFEGADAATEILSRRPLSPTNPNLFIPSAYPDTLPLEPAVGCEPTEEEARELLQNYTAVDGFIDPAEALAIFDSEAAKAKISSPSLRLALVALKGTIGEPAIDFILYQTTAEGLPKVAEVKFEPVPLGNYAGAWIRVDSTTEQMTILANERYRAENPFLFAITLAHPALHQDNDSTNFEETSIRAIDILIYLAQLSRHPELAQTGTELSRRHNYYALLRLNSGEESRLGLYRSNGEARIVPGSPLVFTSWWQLYRPLLPPFGRYSPGNDLLGRYLQGIEEEGRAVCTGEEFNQALLDCIDQNQAALSDEQLVAAATALQLDTATQFNSSAGSDQGR